MALRTGSRSTYTARRCLLVLLLRRFCRQGGLRTLVRARGLLRLLQGRQHNLGHLFLILAALVVVLVVAHLLLGCKDLAFEADRHISVILIRLLTWIMLELHCAAATDQQILQVGNACGVVVP